MYTHFTAPGIPPLPLVASSVWRPRLLVSYKELGTYGVLAAGILEMVVDLFTKAPR